MKAFRALSRPLMGQDGRPGPVLSPTHIADLASWRPLRLPVLQLWMSPQQRL